MVRELRLQWPCLDYRRLSLAEKQQVAAERQRDPAISCPSCDTQTTAQDLLAHVAERCHGPREPSRASIWLTWREARGLGIPGWTLTRWVQAGEVRVKGDKMDRRYLLRDVAMRVANRRRRR